MTVPDFLSKNPPVHWELHHQTQPHVGSDQSRGRYCPLADTGGNDTVIINCKAGDITDEQHFLFQRKIILKRDFVRLRRICRMNQHVSKDH